MLFASECQSRLVPRNIAVRGLIGHTLILESEFGIVVDKSALTGQDKTFAPLFLRIGYCLLKQLACIPMLAVSRAFEILGCK